jgi:signal transduction histidine kinase
MRRRLTVSILVLVAVTLVVTSIGSYYFIQRAALSTVQQELSGQGRAISSTISTGPAITKAGFRRELQVIAEAGAFQGIAIVALHPTGTITGALPAGITIGQLDVPALQAGDQVNGHDRSFLVYTAVPTRIAHLTAYVPVLIITRQVHNPAHGLRYFGLVGVIGLFVAALVAAALARRFTRPLVAAVATTRRIASGDLDATVEVRPREDPEFAQLADSINTMGANLVRARDQERQFILSVSHELRTPLTSIRGYAEAILDGAAEDPAEAATVISAEAWRLERLVQDLLDLARLDADRFSFEFQAVDCAEAVRQVVDGFRPRAGELGLELIAAPVSDGPLWVRADSDRLVQILANLVENASSFAARRIVVGASTMSGGPTVWVVDDGPGIPPDQLSRVFERHFTSDRVSGRRKGSGLGLAIVSELAAAMGATVRAESPASGGEGTRLVVQFRSGGQPVPTTGQPVPAAPPGHTDSADTSGCGTTGTPGAA